MSLQLTVTGFIILLIIAALCGAIGRRIAGGTRGGFFVAAALGFIGALLGPAVARAAHLPEPLMLSVSGEHFPILWSIIGAALFVALIRMMTGRR